MNNARCVKPYASARWVNNHLYEKVETSQLIWCFINEKYIWFYLLKFSKDYNFDTFSHSWMKNLITCPNRLTFFLHPCNVLDILDIIGTVADRWLWHGRGCWQTVNVFHENILRWLAGQTVGGPSITAEIKNENK